MPAAKQIEFGGHALDWVGDWSEQSARKAISSAAKNGYDYIELAILWRIMLTPAKRAASGLWPIARVLRPKGVR